MKLELPVALKPIQLFFVKHHAVLFITFIMLLLTTAVYLLYTSSTAQEVESPVSTLGSFDEETINKIKNLKDKEDTLTQVTFPKNRINPFVE